jgi:parallel beta-helix repeat protein
MKKITILVIVIGMLILTSLVSVNATKNDMLNKQLSAISPETHHSYIDFYVDDDAPPGGDGSYEHPFQTINEGVNAAEDGDAIFVFSGIYDDYLHFSKSINLIGENKETTTIIHDVQINNVDNIIVRGFTFMEGGYGVILGDCNDCIISGNVFVTYRGIVFLDSSNCIIKNNIFSNGYSAIEFKGSCNNSISGNYIHEGEGYGIIISHSSDNNIFSDNTITNNDETGIDISHSNNNIITDNTITNNNWDGIHIFHTEFGNNILSDNTITNNGWSGIYIRSSDSNNTLSNNIITNNNKTGIDISSKSNIGSNIISKNTVTNNNMSGVNIIYSYNNVILSDNTIENNGVSGVDIYDSDNITITDNTITKNNYAGVYLAFSDYNTIKENTITGKYPNDDNFGICLGGFVTHTTISENTIMNNSRGIYLSLGCKKNIVSKNEITNNGQGIGMGRGENNIGYASKNKIIGNNITDTTRYGIYCEEGSRNNKIYYNNFINNGNSGGAGNAYDIGSSNTWYKYKLFGKSMGNYWDDYTGVDENPKDGVGDTPYRIPGKKIPSKDRYPVMEPFDIENIEVTSEELETQELLSNKNIQSSQSSSPANN